MRWTIATIASGGMALFMATTTIAALSVGRYYHAGFYAIGAVIWGCTALQAWRLRK